MSEFITWIQDKINQELVQNKQGMICKIVSFDSSKMRASVQPLLQVKNEGDDPLDYSQLDDVLVGFLYAGGGAYIKPGYVAADLVWVSFSTHDMDLAREGTASVESADINNMSNCIVMHGLVPDGWSAPGNWLTDGLVIGDEKLTMQLLDGNLETINENGSFKLAANGTYTVHGDKLEVTP